MLCSQIQTFCLNVQHPEQESLYDDDDGPFFGPISIMFIQFLRLGNLIFPFFMTPLPTTEMYMNNGQWV